MTKITSPRDVATGHTSGKRQHQVSLTKQTVTAPPAATGPAKADTFTNAPAKIATSHAIVSPRDSASGLPTGKRMHKPYTF